MFCRFGKRISVALLLVLFFIGFGCSQSGDPENGSLEKPASAVAPLGTREAITIAGYPLQQVLYSDDSREILLGEFEVDYDAPLASKIMACRFDFAHEDITAEHFPYAQSGKRKLRLRLINTGKEIQGPRTLEAMRDRLGRRDADLAQLLEVARRFPELQREFSIAAFGSRWREPPMFAGTNGFVSSPAIHGCAPPRTHNRMRSLWLYIAGAPDSSREWALVIE